MSSIIVSGDTSGAITIAAPAVSGTNTLTLPAATGTVALTGAAVTRSQLPTGSVLQVINFNTTSQTSTTSTSFVTTNITASITPTSATSKILIIATYISNDTNVSGQSFHTLYRNSTNLGGVNGMTQFYLGSSIPMSAPINMMYLDSPATTSATSYTAYVRSGGGQTINIVPNGENGTITLMEIAA